MSELIANTNLTLKVTPIAPPPPADVWTPGDPNNPADMTLVTQEASAAKAEGAKILINGISWTVTPGACSLSGGTHLSGASVVPIAPSATNVRCDNILVLREGDVGTCAGVFTVGSLTVPCSCIFSIDDAGQSTVKGE